MKMKNMIEGYLFLFFMLVPLNADMNLLLYANFIIIKFHPISFFVIKKIKKP
jgi:hypothetical protein